jgi:hypothetical protein
MTRPLTLPALRSDDTLGFLAALGVLQLCRHSLSVETTLRWDGLGGAAVLESSFDDVKSLADALASTATDWCQAGRLTPASGPVIRQALSTKARAALEDAGALDPMRLHVQGAVDRFATQQDSEVLHPDAVDAAWLCALVGQLSPAKRGEPERRLTPLYSPSGQMTLYQLYRDARDDVCRRPGVMLEALVDWRRHPGTGANLDSRALVDASAATGGKPSNRAVPGATWLALQALPFFLQTGDGSRGEVTSWPRHGKRGGLGLRWPVWTPPLDVAAVRVLLAHPVLADLATSVTPARDDAKRKAAQQAEALGICAVLRSSRKALAKSAGALQPPDLIWMAAL